MAAPQDIPALPRLAQPLKDGMKGPGDLFTASPKPSSTPLRVAQTVGKIAKDHGQSPNGGISPKARKLLESAESAVLTKEQKDAIASGGVGAVFREWTLWFIKTDLGWPFRQEYYRKVAAVVLGQPYGDVGIIVDAIDSLTRFAVCSLTEDKYGNVQRDVKLIIQTFTATITKLETFKKSTGFHWTDIEKKQESPEVDTILAALKGGLNDLVSSFGDYSEDLRLSQSEMRMAREAAATPIVEKVPEMEQRK